MRLAEEKALRDRCAKLLDNSAEPYCVMDRFTEVLYGLDARDRGQDCHVATMYREAVEKSFWQKRFDANGLVTVARKHAIIPVKEKKLGADGKVPKKAADWLPKVRA